MPPYVVITLLSSLLFAAGMTLQKRAVSERGLRAGLSSRGWGLGLAALLGAGTLQALAISQGDVSVVKPLGLSQCVFALAIGVVLLGERLHGREALGAAAILVGGLLLAFESAAVAPNDAGHAPGDIALPVAGGALLASSLLFTIPHARARPELPLALAAGVFFGCGDALLKAAFEIVGKDRDGFSATSLDALGALVSCAEFQLFLAGSAVGLALHQLAYRGGRIAVISPISAVTSAAVPAALGVALLGEPLGPTRAMGAGLLLTGASLVGAAARTTRQPQLLDPLDRQSTRRFVE